MLEDIRKRNEKHKQLKNSGDIYRAFEIKHIMDEVPNDIDTLLSLIDKYKEALEYAQANLVNGLRREALVTITEALDKTP